MQHIAENVVMVLFGWPQGSIRADMGHLQGCIWLQHRGCIYSIWQYTLHMAAGWWLAGHRGHTDLRQHANGW